MTCTRPDGHGLLGAGSADAGTFLARLVRLDPGAVVRLRPAGPASIALWAALPWDVLVSRQVPGEPAGDVTVGAADLLAALTAGRAELPVRRDTRWRWSLPPDAVAAIETLPGDEVRAISTAAAEAWRTASRQGVNGLPVGERVLRDRLLDHVAITATGDDRRAEVSMRLVLGLLRMGFLGPAGGRVSVLVAPGWVGLAGRYGVVWRYQRVDLGLRTRSVNREA